MFIIKQKTFCLANPFLLFALYMLLDYIERDTALQVLRHYRIGKSSVQAIRNTELGISPGKEVHQPDTVEQGVIVSARGQYELPSEAGLTLIYAG